MIEGAMWFRRAALSAILVIVQVKAEFCQWFTVQGIWP